MFLFYMITQGAAQQRGRQIGITAAPPFSPLSSFDLDPLSAAYDALKYWPEKNNFLENLGSGQQLKQLK